MNKYNFETRLSTRQIVDLLNNRYGYIIFPRKLNAVLRGNKEPDEKLRRYLYEIQTERTQYSVKHHG